VAGASSFLSLSEHNQSNESGKEIRALLWEVQDGEARRRNAKNEDGDGKVAEKNPYTLAGKVQRPETKGFPMSRK